MTWAVDLKNFRMTSLPHDDLDITSVGEVVIEGAQRRLCHVDAFKAPTHFTWSKKEPLTLAACRPLADSMAV
jgi:hypothetical protein